MSALSTWPKVFDEDQTLDAVLSGKSIARYGDGEFNIALGGNCVSQTGHPDLASELRDVLYNPEGDCIVGTVRPGTPSPKNWFWDNIVSREKIQKLHNQKAVYYSSWISRPDSAPWVDRLDYWKSMFSLWRGKDVTLVAGSFRSLTREKLKHANSVELIECSYRDAFSMVDDLEKKCLSSPNKTILLCCGPTATILAKRLSKKGKHALDLGHIGMFSKLYEKHDLG